MPYIEKLISKTKAFCVQSDFFEPHFNYNFINFNLKLFAERNIIFLNTQLLGDFFHFTLKCDYKTDHAGFYIGINIFGLDSHINIYDIRHWDFDKNQWY